jgi:choline dehydrogenase
MAEHFDFVIIGAGAAGCIIAKEIASNNPDKSVALLEAGANNNEERFVNSGIGSLFKIWFTESDWQLHTTPQAGLNGREIIINQGKVLGGGTSINAMMYVRGHEHNFSEWHKLSGHNPNWSPARIKDSLKAVEGCLGPWADPEVRGMGGPVKISQPANPSLSSGAFLAGCTERGYQQGDFNGAVQNNHSDYMQLIVDAEGNRCSSARAYVNADIPKNLVLKCNATVSKLLIEQTCCQGVELADGSQINGSKVILTAGALQTPQLLMASGIGDATLLEASGIPCQVDNPHIGRNLSDHMRVMLAYRSDKDPGQTDYLCEAALFTQTGISDRPETDIQINFSAGVEGFVPEEFLSKEASALTKTVIFVPVLTKPFSTGSITPQRVEGKLQFSINPNYLKDERDLAAYKRGLEIARSIATTQAMDGYCVEEICPGPAIDDADYLRTYATTIWHPVGTCSVSAQASNGACSGDFKVWGTDNVYVADASIIPTLTSGNPQAAIFALAKIASKVIAN